MRLKILLLLALLGVGGYLFIGGVRVPQTESSLRKHAEEVLVRCQKEEFTPNCYDKEIPKLMRFMSMEDAFGVTRYVQEKDPKYRFCHVLAHELSYLETAKDPENWMDTMARCPATMCNNGCPHGVLMYKFKSESLSDSQIESILPDLKEVCEPRGKWQPSEVEIGMCYHGIGHLNMYITDADIDKSLELCEKIGVKDDGRSYYQTCVQGVFMIVFQGVEPEDFALVADIKPEKEGVASFCAPYSGLEYNACRTEAWPLFVDQIREPEGLTQFCSFTTDDRYNGWCYETGLSLRVLELLEIGDGAGTEAVSDYCMALPQNRRAICFSFAATRFVQVDPEYTQVSVSLCESAEKYGFRESCLDDLLYYSTYSFAKGSESHERYCSKLPNDYHARCEEGSIPDRLYSWYERN